MKQIFITADHFFEMLKLKGASMWEIFGEMIDGESKEIIFTNGDQKILFGYILPATASELEADRQKFAAEFADKIGNLN